MIYQQAQLLRVDNQWQLLCSTTQQTLKTFPVGTPEDLAFYFLSTLQAAESKAYKEGVEDTKGATLAAQTQRINDLVSHINSIEYHNQILAEKLDSIIGG